MQLRRHPFRLIALVLALALLATACVLGPIAGPGQIALSSGIDVADVDYQRSEFFLVETAKSYSSADPLSADGRWTVTADELEEPFWTRLVVHRPVDPADFDGTVVVEWLNVTAGADLPNDWVTAHNRMIREGHAWVGVSAQAVGVNAVKANDPTRYGHLFHPGDSYSYDIFSQAGQAIRDVPKILGNDLDVEVLLATGESQSASRLVTYVNAVHPIDGIYDGYMIHSRGSGGSSLRQDPLDPIATPRPGLLRDDLDVPVMVVQSEDDVIRSNLGIRQPDTPLYRSWEMAGTAHADSYTINAGYRDIGDGSGTAEMFDYLIDPQDAGCTKPVNAGPHWLILQAAFAGLEHWVRSGVAPPVGPPLDTESTDPTVLARDQWGNALGGIRSPHVEVPIATIDGLNSGFSFCRLFGSTTPLSAAQLAALYPTHDDFVTAWTASLDATIAAGFILPEDRADLVAAAEASTIGG
ncbi:MAG: alpha/beta hydrolase domain-containing protein [Acidimicrobiales bacterium]